ncbi:MAG: ribonuclease E activity regulator RraA, partial [Pseudomonadota bacterium]
MTRKTADLYDDHAAALSIAEPVFVDFGGRRSFHGEIATVKVFEDNVLVKRTLGEPGNGRVLVVDGGGSTRCALLGDMLAAMAIDSGWSGLVVNGAIRDSEEVGDMDLGVKALATCPAKSVKRGEGQVGVPVRFAGVTFTPGAWLYADGDGIVV